MRREPTQNGSKASASWWLLAGGALWGVGLAFCAGALLSYSYTDGSASASPSAWPAGALQPLAAVRPSLLMFAHPRCPCTPASLAELERIVAETGSRADVRVVFYRPGGEADAWVEGPNWQAALRLPGADRVIDADGALARRFGARTSGHVVLYSPAGELLFSGGITAGRGHEGESAGRAALVQLIRGEPGSLRRSPVFGCALMEELAQTPSFECCQEEP